MNIREFYVKNYPTDDMGKGINPNATFDGLWNVLKTYGDVYEYLYAVSYTHLTLPTICSV